MLQLQNGTGTGGDRRLETANGRRIQAIGRDEVVAMIARLHQSSDLLDLSGNLRIRFVFLINGYDPQRGGMGI